MKLGSRVETKISWAVELRLYAGNAFLPEFVYHNENVVAVACQYRPAAQYFAYCMWDVCCEVSVWFASSGCEVACRLES